MYKKRYLTLSHFLHRQFGCRVYKIPVNAGFTCPNRDGTVGTGGCTFCYNPSFSPVADTPAKSIREQILEYKTRLSHRKRQAKYLAYFQSYTNTYAPPNVLRSLYREALSVPDVVGLCIGTRPDCVPNPVLNVIEEYARDHHVWLEYGLQSIHNKTLRLINRGHTAEDFLDAVSRTKGRGIYICAHVILGLPGETLQDMLTTARALNDVGVDGVKIHHLQIIRHTKIAEDYLAGKNIDTLSVDEYVHLVCTFLEHLSPEIVIHRLCGEVLAGEMLLAPVWNLPKTDIINKIDKELNRRGSYQGSRVNP
ncbi:MAG: TIGR01212 family radical SAM protein [Peptococcaceae bacterium]|nr:TIGR01212 family radical SAM protein [Peptococcaceae bacterium]